MNLNVKLTISTTGIAIVVMETNEVHARMGTHRVPAFAHPAPCPTRPIDHCQPHHAVHLLCYRRQARQF
jgi:hypothetical protein